MSLFHSLLLAVFSTSIIVVVFLLFVDAPYGKRERTGWGPGINPRLSWILWEAPAFFSFLITFYLNDNNSYTVPRILAAFFLIHYAHRTFIYPFTIRIKPGAKSPLLLLVSAMLFNAINGWLNAYYIVAMADYLYKDSWLLDWRFILGVSLFVFGFVLAKDSDHRLRNLRLPGDTSYKIPFGGGFRWVSCPNYLGEIIQWLGFAIMAWSPAGLAFVCFTAANLFPRALASHRWYHEKFSDYPVDRKAIFPFVI